MISEQIEVLNAYILQEWKNLCEEYPFELKNIETPLFDIKSVERIVKTNIKNLGMKFYISTTVGFYDYYHLKDEYFLSLNLPEDFIKKLGITEKELNKKIRIVSKCDKIKHFS